MGLFAFNLARQREAEKKRIENEKQAVEIPPKEPNIAKLNGFKLPELKAIAKKRKLTGYSKLPKAELLKLLEGV